MTEESMAQFPIEQQFLIEQFRTLRQEIEASKERAFRVYGIGILIVPALSQLLQYLSHTTKPDNEHDATMVAIGLLFPFFILAVMLFFQAENGNIKRCGLYIRDNIEAHISNYGIKGWETWLTNTQRHDPQYAAKSFYFIFLLYYYSTCIIEVTNLYFMFTAPKVMFTAPLTWGIVSLAGLIYLFLGMAVQCSFYHSVFYSYKRDAECPLYNFIFNKLLAFLPKDNKQEGSCA